MPNARENVCYLGTTGSEQRTVKVTRLTQRGHFAAGQGVQQRQLRGGDLVNIDGFSVAGEAGERANVSQIL